MVTLNPIVVIGWNCVIIFLFEKAKDKINIFYGTPHKDEGTTQLSR